MSRQTVFTDKNDLLRQIGVPEEDMKADADMKLVIPPHLMMQTCEHCADNCRGCFRGNDGAQFCYECIHGYIFDKTEEKCVVDPTWAATESEIKVRASKRSISKCDQVKVRMDPEAGFNPEDGLKEIAWNIHISDMDINERLNAMLQNLISSSRGNNAFVIDKKLTSMLKIGAKIKIVGFALGENGITVTDAETIEVSHNPEYSLAYEKSYYILAEDGLSMDIRKRQEQCPNVKQTVTELNEDDLSRLSCRLLSVDRAVISELPLCQVAKDSLVSNKTYLIEVTWKPVGSDEPEAQVHP